MMFKCEGSLIFYMYGKVIKLWLACTVNTKMLYKGPLMLLFDNFTDS